MSVRLSVCPSVTAAVSGVRGADEQQRTKFGPTYSVRLQSFHGLRSIFVQIYDSSSICFIAHVEWSYTPMSISRRGYKTRQAYLGTRYK